MNTDKPNPGGGSPPHRYKILIDKDVLEIDNGNPTGRELLQYAKKEPPEQYAIYLKVKGAQPQRIDLDQKVDLTKPGVERFVTLPLDQTEGFDGRRDFELPQEDLDWLRSTGRRFELVAENNVLRVVISGFPVPPGYDREEADVNVRIDPGYPDTQIDMVYVHPHLARIDGRPISALASDAFDGRDWQRWSRHRTPANPWRSGIDNLATHFALVRYWFSREVRKA